MPNTNITCCVTSCSRPDLLQRTLESFYAHTDVEPQALIICEDSADPMPEFLKDPIWRGRNLVWLSNGGRKGQIYSADRLMQLVTTPYVFWLEDDFEFVERGFMQKSRALLDEYANISMVSLRGDVGWHPLEKDPAYNFSIAQPYWKDVWGGFCFNPGVRRLKEWQRLGSFGKHVGYGTHGLGHESHLSKLFLDAGYMIADIGTYARHIGEGRSKAIEPLPDLPKILIAIPACFKFDYSRWESSDSPLYNEATAWEHRPYGSDIHISGDNPRIDAVRETWGRDVAAFPNVTLKFFYGRTPAGYPRPPLDDEAYITCGDTYADLPQKTIDICRYMVREKYDYVFKCDDDTYVWVDRLVHELLTYKFDYAGWANGGVASGGPGYWLSNRAARCVAENSNPDCWAEDVHTGKVMGQNGVSMQYLQSHKPGFTAHWFYPQGFDPAVDTRDFVTIHAVQPEVMRALYEHESRGR